MHLLGIQRLAAFRADHNRIEQMPTFLVFVQQRAAALVKHMNIAPVHNGHEHGVKVEPLLREDVLVAFGAFLVGDTAEHTEPDQLSQAFGKKVAGNPKTRLELIKAAHAEKAFAQNQKCPAITNHSHRSRHGARLGFEFVPFISCPLQIHRLARGARPRTSRQFHIRIDSTTPDFKRSLP